jgi:hypothetical protein
VHAASAGVLHFQELHLVFGELEAETFDDLVLLVDELGIASGVTAMD